MDDLRGDPASHLGVSSTNRLYVNVPEADDPEDASLHDSPHESSFTSQNAMSPSASEFVDFKFSSKGIHICNLNIRHILPKIDDIRITLSSENGPDILGMCETFLKKNNPDSQLSINGFNFMRKDRTDIQDKAGGGLLLYYKQSLQVTRRNDLEISNIESIWAEIILPNSRPFLICTVYRPPNALSSWVDLFEEELSKAHATGFELLLMGDFNIDITSCTNPKWNNLIQLFDLLQIVKEPTRVTHSTSTIIDHVYTTKPENIIECFVPHYAISDHYPICITRKVNFKIPKTEHIISTYRCFKKFNENAFLSDLESNFQNFELVHQSVDDDFESLYSIIINQLDRYAPIKQRRVKSRRLPDWYTPEIGEARKIRDKYKHSKNWSEYKRYRNKTSKLIKNAKRNHFSDSIENFKDTKTIWKHLRTINTSAASTNSTLPSELKFANESLTDSKEIATKLNEYFASVAKVLNSTNTETSEPDLSKLQDFVNGKVPDNVSFKLPYITCDQVASYISALDPSKATGLDGLGPKIIKLASNLLSPIVAAHINKSINSGTFPSQLKCAKVFPIFKGGVKTDPVNYRPISILPTVSKIFEKTCQ